MHMYSFIQVYLLTFASETSPSSMKNPESKFDHVIKYVKVNPKSLLEHSLTNFVKTFYGIVCLILSKRSKSAEGQYLNNLGITYVPDATN